MAGTERHVEFEACFNFRDLGGYETADGRRVRWGAVYRSDALHRLTPADVGRAQRLGLRTVIDLRSGAELTETGRFGAHVTFHHVPLEESIPVEPPRRDEPEPPPGVVYAAMAAAGASAIADTMHVLARCDHAAVFHCAAGKDRTGIIAALLLSALGVPDPVIVADYHLSERSLVRAMPWADANEPEWAAKMAAFPPWLLRAPAESMQAFLDILRERHGSVAGYLSDAGVEREAVDELRARLLQP